MIQRFLTLLCLLLLPCAAWAEGDLLIKLDLKSVDGSTAGKQVRSLGQTMRVRSGGTAQLTLKAEPDTGFMSETWRIKPTLLEKERIRVESTIEVRIGLLGSPQHSKFASTLLQGEPWEASVDSADGHVTLEYKITAWSIPEGMRFQKFDANGQPQWVKGREL